jgi:hypothetical protein
MKAKEWAERISKVVIEIESKHPFNLAPIEKIDKHVVVISELVKELDADLKRLKEERHVTKLAGFKSILLELNQKWNAIAKNPKTMLAVDGYLKLWQNRMPVETEQVLNS